MEEISPLSEQSGGGFFFSAETGLKIRILLHPFPSNAAVDF